MTKRIHTQLTHARGDLQQRCCHGADSPGETVGSRDAVGGMLPQGPQEWLVQVDHVSLKSTESENKAGTKVAQQKSRSRQARVD